MNKTKYLHELVAHARVGVKFQAILGYLGDEGEWLDSESFLTGRWTIEEVTQPWVFKEIKEPRVVEFEAIPSKETNQYAKIWAKELLPLKGVKCRVVVTEVIDE